MGSNWYAKNRPALKVTGNIFLDGQLYRFKEYSELTFGETQVLNKKDGRFHKVHKNGVPRGAKTRTVEKTVDRAVWETECPLCLKPFTILTPVNWPFYCSTPVRNCPEHRNVLKNSRTSFIFETEINRMLDESLLVSVEQFARALGVSKENELLRTTLKKLRRARLIFLHKTVYTKTYFNLDYARQVICHEINRSGGMGMEAIYNWFVSLAPADVKMAVWFNPLTAVSKRTVANYVGNLVIMGFVKREGQVYKLSDNYAAKEAEYATTRQRSARASGT